MSSKLRPSWCAPLPWALAVAALLASGCRGEDLPNDCDYQGQQFFERAENERVELLSPVPDKGPFPVALQLTEDGINRLLAGAVASQEVPFSGELPLGGLANASFEADTDPVIALAPVSGCRNCILFRLEFTVRLATGDDPLSSGKGFVEMSIPLRLESDEASGVSTLIADYSLAEIETLEFAVYGIDSEEHQTLTGALIVLLTENIQENFGPVDLLEIGSWTIGQDQVRLLARDLVVRPDDGKLVVGMHTNLPLPEGAGLDLAGPLPDGYPMAVTMDTDLFLAMSHRMFDEGEIARRYDDNGDPDPEGDYGVTLSSLTGSELNDQLDSIFQVWRVDQGYCGFVQATMPFDVMINNTATGITITPGMANLVPGEGSFSAEAEAAIQEESDLIEDGQDLIANFRDDLADAIKSTVNYDSLDLDGSTIIFAVKEVDVEPAAINSYLDFLVVQDADDGT